MRHFICKECDFAMYIYKVNTNFQDSLNSIMCIIVYCKKSTNMCILLQPLKIKNNYR